MTWPRGAVTRRPRDSSGGGGIAVLITRKAIGCGIISEAIGNVARKRLLDASTNAQVVARGVKT